MVAADHMQPARASHTARKVCVSQIQLKYRPANNYWLFLDARHVRFKLINGMYDLSIGINVRFAAMMADVGDGTTYYMDNVHIVCRTPYTINISTIHIIQ